MPGINLDHEAILRLAKGLQRRFGNEASIDEVMEEVAASVGWQADALRQRLKKEARATVQPLWRNRDQLLRTSRVILDRQRSEVT